MKEERARKIEKEIYYIIFAIVMLLLLYYINMPQFTFCEININIPGKSLILD